MERVGVAKLAKGVMMIMVLLLVHAAVEADARRYDKKCYRKCSAGCVGKMKPICLYFCMKRCKLPPLTNLNDTCVFGCAESTCNHISPPDLDKVEACVDACSEKCKIE